MQLALDRCALTPHLPTPRALVLADADKVAEPAFWTAAPARPLLLLFCGRRRRRWRCDAIAFPAACRIHVSAAWRVNLSALQGGCGAL